MGTSISTLDKKIINNLPQLNIRQKKAIWSLIKCYLEPQRENDRWEEMESGKVKLYTLDETEVHARESYKSKKLKKK